MKIVPFIGIITGLIGISIGLHQTWISADEPLITIARMTLGLTCFIFSVMLLAISIMNWWCDKE